MFLPLNAMINATFLDHFFPCYAFIFPCFGHINVPFYNTTKEFTGVIKTLCTSIQLQQWTNCLTVTKTSEPVQHRAGSHWERGLMSSQAGGLGSDMQSSAVSGSRLQGPHSGLEASLSAFTHSEREVPSDFGILILKSYLI